MALNPVMPDDASIDTEEFADGASTVQREEQPGAEPIQQRTSPEGESRESAPAQDDINLDEEKPDGTESEDDKASEAGKELAKRKRGLEGRKQTIQQQINALVRERGEIGRETARERAEREQLQREIEHLRSMRDRLAAGEDVDPNEVRAGRRDASDPRGFDPRRPVAADDERAPWNDPQDPRPSEAHYNDFAEYAEAVGRWGARQEVRKAEFIRDRRQQMSERAKWEEQRQTKYAERYQAFAKANPEFEQETNRDDLVLTPPMVDVVKDSEVGPQMLLHFARNPEDLDRIARLHPVLAFGEMKKLEARLEGAHSGSRQSTTDKPVTHSQARPPIKPVESSSSRTSESTEIPDEDVDVDEHIAIMNRRDQLLRKRGIRNGYGLRI